MVVGGGGGGGGGGDDDDDRDLIFDGPLDKWTQTRKGNATSVLSGLDTETAQQVLDELQEAMNSGSINRPLAWLRKVAEKAKTGGFEPTNEIDERRKREKAQKNGGNSE